MTSSAMIKRCLGGTVLVGLLLVSVLYVSFFNRPTPRDTLANNRRLKSRSISSFVDKPLHNYDFERKPIEAMTPSEYSHAKWNAWVEVNDYVSIGEVYDKCDGRDRIMVGRVIMISDTQNVGLISRTFSNLTLDHDVTSGVMYTEVRYNGQELFSGHWDLCTVDVNWGERIIYCPLTKGKHKYIKDLSISNYLPKGRYETKTWATDQNDQQIACTYSDFTL